jgi:hypothetical protein
VDNRVGCYRGCHNRKSTGATPAQPGAETRSSYLPSTTVAISAHNYNAGFMRDVLSAIAALWHEAFRMP